MLAELLLLSVLSLWAVLSICWFLKRWLSNRASASTADSAPAAQPVPVLPQISIHPMPQVNVRPSVVVHTPPPNAPADYVPPPWVSGFRIQMSPATTDTGVATRSFGGTSHAPASITDGTGLDTARVSR